MLAVQPRHAEIGKKRAGGIGGLPLWFGCDGNLDVSTLFEPHIIAMFVS